MATKELKLGARPGGERKFVLSSNLLSLMGFTPGTRIRRTALPGLGGLEIAFDAKGAQQVYERTYKGRKSNPFEAQLDIAAKSVLDAAFPGYTQRVHVTMTPGKILVVPTVERAFAIRRAFRASDAPLRSVVALSAGVDAYVMRAAGLQPDALLEWRPQERRDTRDLTETGVMTALANVGFRRVFNEDLRTVDFTRLKSQLGGETYGCMMISVQCDDFSSQKSASLKQRAVEDLETTRDMTYDAMRLIQEVGPASIAIEQVPGYATSPEAELLILKLRRWGYTVQTAILDARDFGGLTSRKRFYLIASLFGACPLPTPTTPDRPGTALWDSIIAPSLHLCRDITDTYGVRKGIRTGRERVITPESRFAPTVTRSQSRGTADQISMLAPDGRYYAPTEQMLQQFNGIDPRFTFAATTQEQAVEQIGQSIDAPLHMRVMVTIREHLEAAWSGTLGGSTPSPSPAHEQMPLGL